MRKNGRLRLGGIVVALLVALVVPSAARAAQPSTGVCDWGGTAAAPTGYLTFSPGLTMTPSPTPIRFFASGPSQGGPCRSTVTFEGTMPAGATCLDGQFDQKVEGVPGVTTAYGAALGTAAQEILRNADGQVVGFNDPSIDTPLLVHQIAADPSACSQPSGFTHAAFYSILTVFGAGSHAAPSNSRLCTWGGTPAAPTGQTKASPGLTNTPSPQPIDFYASGELSGGGPCTGTMTFRGVLEAGATCATSMFDGNVEGVAGIAFAHGPVLMGLVHEFLYDHQGNTVGSDQASVDTLANITDPNDPAFSNCNTPGGLTGGNFSATVELYPSYRPGK